ncbi:MAG TPA: hypothetical protein VLL52_04000, partial [Anaerolineae bacterium]|nr:hypothetical protein [Anaerolineae bacterium]
HKVNAVWFRLGGRINIQQWSDDVVWQGRVPGGERWQSTNHLMGDGYWVWLIPLAGGATSVGIVMDSERYALSDVNRFEKALAWLEAHEPQCAAEVGRLADRVQDFRCLRHFSHGCRQVFSAEGWCLTGEAGMFLDPLYSPGSDFIGISNSLVANLIERSLDGEDMTAVAARHEKTYRQLFELMLMTYEKQYGIMGSCQPMMAKIGWDSAILGTVIVPLFIQNAIVDDVLMAELEPFVAQIGQLQARMQLVFRQWAELDRTEAEDFFFAIQDWGFMHQIIRNVVGETDRAEMRRRMAENVILMEQLAVGMFAKASYWLGEQRPLSPINPYALSLNPAEWAEEGLFAGERLWSMDEVEVTGLDRLWLDERTVKEPVPVWQFK